MAFAGAVAEAVTVAIVEYDAGQIQRSSSTEHIPELLFVKVIVCGQIFEQNGFFGILLQFPHFYWYLMFPDDNEESVRRLEQDSYLTDD